MVWTDEKMLPWHFWNVLNCKLKATKLLESILQRNYNSQPWKMETTIKARPERLSWPNKQWHLIHVFCGLLLVRNGIISYSLWLSQQLTKRQETAVIEMSRKHNWIRCIIDGADYGTRFLHRRGEWKSEVFSAILPILGHPVFPVLRS